MAWNSPLAAAALRPSNGIAQIRQVSKPKPLNRVIRNYSCASKTASPMDEMHEFMAFFALTLFQESSVCGFPFGTGEVECNPKSRVERF
jgi:hypothetical protein